MLGLEFELGLSLFSSTVSSRVRAVIGSVFC